MASDRKQQKMTNCMFQIMDKEHILMAITQELELFSKGMEMHN